MTDQEQDDHPLQRVDDWFRLDSYRQARTEGAEWWRDQIGKRRFIRIFAEPKSAPPWRDRILGCFFRAPLTYELPREYERIWGGALEPTDPSDEALPYTTRTIKPLTFQEADDIIHSLNDANQKAGKDSQGNKPTPSQRVYDDYLTQEGKDLGFGHLKVDIEARDKQLVQDFKAWLKAYRAATGRNSPKPLNQDNFVKWHDDLILPAFDLLAWQEWMNDRSLTYDRLAELLYPQRETTYPRIDRLKRKVNDVVSRVTERRLTNQLPD